MKLHAALTCLLSFIVSSAAFASNCTDFSGVYQFAPNPAELTLTVTQNACASVTFTYVYSPSGETLERTFVTDGQRRQTGQSQGQIVYETAKMAGTQMTNTVEFFETATNTTTTAISTFELDGNGNLDALDNYYDATGKLYSTDTIDFNKSKQ